MPHAPIDHAKVAKAKEDVARFEEQLARHKKIQKLKPHNRMLARMIERCEFDLMRAREQVKFHSLPAWTSF